MTWYCFDAASLMQQGAWALVKGEFGLADKIMIFIANIIFTLSTFITRFAIEIMLIGFNSQLIVNYGQEIVKAAAEIWNGGQHAGIRNTLLFLVLSVTGFYYIFRLMQARFSDIIRAALITILVLGLSAVYFANAGRILTTTTDVIDSISGAVFSVIATDEDIPIEDPQQRGQIAFASKVWDVMVISPWAYAQFGTLETTGLKLDAEERDKLTEVLDTAKTTAKANLSEDTRIDQVLLALPPGSPDRHNAVNIFQDEEVNHGGHPQTTYTLSPMISFEKFLYSLIALVGSVIFMVFACSTGALLFIADVTVIFSLAIAPFIAVIALIPETGWGIAIRWLKALLSALFAKIFYGIYVGILFLIIGVILTGTSVAFLFKMLLLCIVLIFGFVYRKKLIDTVSEAVNLNGEQKAPGGRFISTLLKHKLVDKMLPGKLKGINSNMRSNQNKTQTPPDMDNKQISSFQYWKEHRRKKHEKVENSRPWYWSRVVPPDKQVQSTEPGNKNTEIAPKKSGNKNKTPGNTPADNQAQPTGTDNRGTKGDYRHSPAPYQKKPESNKETTNQVNHKETPKTVSQKTVQPAQQNQQQGPPKQNNRTSQNTTGSNKITKDNKSPKMQPLQKQPGTPRKLTIKKPSNSRKK